MEIIFALIGYAGFVLMLILFIRWCNRKAILNGIGWRENDSGGMENQAKTEQIDFWEIFILSWKELAQQHPSIIEPIQKQHYQPW